jgi:hypothetical protein
MTAARFLLRPSCQQPSATSSHRTPGSVSRETAANGGPPGMLLMSHLARLHRSQWPSVCVPHRCNPTDEAPRATVCSFT